MKLEVNFSEFKKIVMLAEHLAGKHMTLPVLSCFLFVVKKNVLMIRATNLDMGIDAYIPAKADTEASFAVPASVLAAFLSQIGDFDGVVRLEEVSQNIQISAAKSKGVIKTVPSEDFPDIPQVADGQSVSLTSHILAKGLKSVWYSASVSSVKPELSSVYVYTNDNKLYFVSTDSFRLAEKAISLPSHTKVADLLIPFKNIADTTRVLESFDANFELKTSKNLMSLEIPNKIRLVSRVIDGVFPDYKQIVPKTSMTEVVVLKQDLLNALKISNVFSDKFNQVHFLIDPKAKLFEIQTKNNDIGENKTNIDGAITGEKIEINFNYKYIIDCFQSIDSDSMSLQLGGMNRPMVIRPISGDQSFMYLIMPMNR